MQEAGWQAWWQTDREPGRQGGSQGGRQAGWQEANHTAKTTNHHLPAPSLMHSTKEKVKTQKRQHINFHSTY